MSKSMTYDRVYDLFFKRLFDRTIQPPEAPMEIWDRNLVDLYLKDLKGRAADKPRFDFFRIHTTHFNYTYPAAFERYKPTIPPEFSIASGRNKDFEGDKLKLKNRYLNSVLYADSLMHEMVDTLKATGAWDNTVVILIGDHGEEFWEQGIFGHTWGLNDPQTRTTALMHFPEPVKTEYRFSSHQDFMPTVFDYIGLDREPDSFMLGKSLLSYDRERDYAFVSVGSVEERVARKHVIIDDRYKVIISTQAGEYKPVGVSDINDKKLTLFDHHHVGKLMKKASEMVEFGKGR